MRRVASYVAAILVVVAALALKYPFASLGDDHPFVLLPAAVILSTWYGGRGPGVLATVVSAIGADVLFLPPFGVGTPGELIALTVLIAEGVLIVWVTGALRAAREQAQRKAAEADNARRSAALALQMRDELMRLWTQKLSGPLAHVLVAVQRCRESVSSGDAGSAMTSLDALQADVSLLQRTAERWIEGQDPRPGSF